MKKLIKTLLHLIDVDQHTRKSVGETLLQGDAIEAKLVGHNAQCFLDDPVEVGHDFYSSFCLQNPGDPE